MSTTHINHSQGIAALNTCLEKSFLVAGFKLEAMGISIAE